MSGVVSTCKELSGDVRKCQKIPVTGDGGQCEHAGDDTDNGVEGRQLAEDCWRKIGDRIGDRRRKISCRRLLEEDWR